MRGQINADSALLERVARELDRIAADVSRGNNRLTQAREETLSAWQSSLTGQFSQSVDTTKNRVGRCAQQTQTLANTLRSTAAAVRRAEQELARRKQQSRSR